MGIHGLMKLISDECPEAVKEQEMEALTGRRVAIDASMAMYQFLVAVRSGEQGHAQMLTNDSGEVTSHIQGMFNRTIRMLSCGIRPAYVFDGRPPALKSEELAKRLARREQAQRDLERAKEEGEAGDVDKYNRRLVKVTRQHNEDCKTLLRLMGVPIVDAPCEAEAQCAELAKTGAVYATATEDMDALTFRSPKLLRRMTFAIGQRQPIMEIDLEKVLRGLDLTYEQFVDLCILCGCDYCSSIKGVGAKTALKYIKQFGSLERVVDYLRREKKIELPADWRPQRIPMHLSKKLEERTYSSRAEALANGAQDEEKDGETKMAVASEDAAAADEASAASTAAAADEASAASTAAAAAESSSAAPAASLSTSAVQESESKTTSEMSGYESDDEAAIGSAPVLPDDEDADLDEEPAEGADASGAAAEDDDLLVPQEGEEVEEAPPLYSQARGLFMSPDVQPASEVKLAWSEPDEEGLTDFLVNKMGFNADRVARGIKRLKDARKLTSQRRVDSFFTVLPNSGQPKRKADTKKGPAATNKKAKPAPKRR